MPPGGDGKGNNFSASVLHLCTFLKLRCLIAKSCPTLLPPHGLSPTMVLCPGNFPGNNTGVGCISFWVSSWPRDWTLVSCIGRQILYHRATREAHIIRQSVELLKKMLCQYCFKAGRGLFVRPQSQDRAMPGAQFVRWKNALSVFGSCSCPLAGISLDTGNAITAQAGSWAWMFLPPVKPLNRHTFGQN